MMSSSKISLLRSARSLKRAKAALTSASDSELDAQLLQPLLEGVAAESLPSTMRVGAPAHVLGAHDLVGVARLEHAVLVDARLAWAKALAPTTALFGLHHEAGGLADQPASAARSGVVSMPDVQAEVVASRAHGHHHLLQRSSCRRARPGR
jgi:hypothetical protein